MDVSLTPFHCFSNAFEYMDMETLLKPSYIFSGILGVPSQLKLRSECNFCLLFFLGGGGGEEQEALALLSKKGGGRCL